MASTFLTDPRSEHTERWIERSAAANVTVAATHRRRGLLSAMIGDSLRFGNERGDPVSILIAAEWPIYGRFGYPPGTVSCDYRLHCRRPGAQPWWSRTLATDGWPEPVFTLPRNLLGSYT